MNFFTWFGIVACYKSNLQSVLALSIIQAEYIMLTKGVNEALWLNGMTGE